MKWLKGLFGHGGMVESIDHVAICVSDMDRSVKYYTETLGLELIRDGRAEGGEKKTFLGVGKRVLVALSENSHRLVDKGRYAEGVGHVAFRVGDVEKASKALSSKGVEFIEIKQGDDPNTKAYHFLDPDGLELEIYGAATEEVPPY